MESKPPLDDPQLYRKLDQGGMLSHLHRLPQQCQQAWQQGVSLKLPPDYRGLKRVVVCGMGGSAIGGDLLQGLAALEGVAVVVGREYQPPPLLDEHTLAIFSSFSGMTEETLSAFEQALPSPAKKLVLTRGGRLGERARQMGIPVLLIAYSAPPRAALAYTFIALLAVLYNVGLVKDKSQDVAEMVGVLEGLRPRLGEGTPATDNPAKGLAQRLQGRLGVLYGAGFLSGVARRWKTQLNENSKAWSFFDLLPELHHNSVVGYQFPQPLARDILVVLLSSPLLPARLLLRYELTRQLLEKAGVNRETITGEGRSPLSQLMSLLYWGDWVSYYLALLYGVDPSPTPAIDYIKQKLGGD